MIMTFKNPRMHESAEARTCEVAMLLLQYHRVPHYLLAVACAPSRSVPVQAHVRKRGR
jgi:hypothetical protein